MTQSRKLLLVIIALVLLADFLPVTREELSWWWAKSHNHSANYLQYLSRWRNGRHAAEAMVLLDERQRAEMKRAQIRQAYMAASQTKSNTDADAAYRHEQRLRRDNFFWKQACTANTVDGYNDYLREFPQGNHSAEAHQKIQALSQPGIETSK
jgi:hypothetical protein